MTRLPRGLPCTGHAAARAAVGTGICPPAFDLPE